MGLLTRTKTGKVQELGTLGDVRLALQNISREDYRSLISQERFEETGEINRVSNELAETMYYYEPMTRSAINRTVMKRISHWFTMDDPTPDKTLNDTIKDLLETTHQVTQLKQKMLRFGKNTYIYGNGFLEIIPERGYQEPSEPIDPGMGHKDVRVVDPVFMDKRIQRLSQDEYLYFHRNKNTGGSYAIHSSRIIHLANDPVGSLKWGRGCPEMAIRSMMAKIGMDWAIGEIMYRYGKPFLVLKTTGATKEDLRMAREILKKINPRTGFMGSEKHEFQILNPANTNPDPYAMYYYMNLAANIEMPTMVFMGVQKGALTGSEVDLMDWGDLLKSKNDLEYTPVIDTINNYILKGKWTGKVYWNEPYINPKANADLQLVQTQTIREWYYTMGAVTDLEARQWARDLGLEYFPSDDNEYTADEDKPEVPILPFPQQPASPDDGETSQQSKEQQQALLDKAAFLLDQLEFWRERKLEGNHMRSLSQADADNSEDAKAMSLVRR
jgi:hypothetical protein